MEPNQRFKTVLKTDKTLQISSEDSSSSKSVRSSFSKSSSYIQVRSFSPKSQQMIESQGKMLKILQAQVNELKAIIFEGQCKREIKTPSNVGFITPKKSKCPFGIIQKGFTGSNYEENFDSKDLFEEKEDRAGSERNGFYYCRDSEKEVSEKEENEKELGGKEDYDKEDDRQEDDQQEDDEVLGGDTEDYGKDKKNFSKQFLNRAQSFKVGNLADFYYDVPKIEYQSLSESESDEELESVQRKYLCKFLAFNHTLK